MSQVYKAVDTVLDRIVAIKILTDEGCRDDDAKKRFLLEARMSGNIIHDNIIRIHDYGEIEGRPFIVMEFLTGEDLRGAIDQGHTGDLKRKISFALQTARALAHVHTKNIVHRDIKPENLHIDDMGRVRLMDFGIAKAHNLSITREGFAVGTPYYMAPEQILGKPITNKADIYSFGIVLYEMLTGVKPVTGETIESLFGQILHQPLNVEPLQKGGLPEPLIQLIVRCTAKNPDERPANFDTVVADLEKIQRAVEGGGPTTTGLQGMPKIADVPVKDTPAKPATTSNLPMIAVGAALLLAVIGGGWYFLHDGDENRGGGGRVTPSPTASPTIAGPPARIQDDFGEMILVPEGAFLSGPDSEVKKLPNYYIDKTEVSVGAWNKYAQKMGRDLIDQPPEMPVTKVSFSDAVDYCAYAGKSLPSADEWEKAARGKEGRTYPWGNEPEPSKANVAGNSKVPAGAPRPVDSMPEGATPNGVLHMAGNVWEWVRDPRKPSARNLEGFKGIKATADEAWTTLRGGGFDADIRNAVSYEFNVVPARLTEKSFGFRCSKAAQ